MNTASVDSISSVENHTSKAISTAVNTKNNSELINFLNNNFDKVDTKELDVFILGLAEKSIIYEKATLSKLLSDKKMTCRGICWGELFFGNNLQSVQEQINNRWNSKPFFSRLFDIPFYLSKIIGIRFLTIENFFDENSNYYNNLFQEKTITISDIVMDNIYIKKNVLSTIEDEVIKYYDSDLFREEIMKKHVSGDF